MNTQNDFTTTITISCNDGTTRVLNVIGRWNYAMASELGKDLEAENFKTVSTTFN